MNGWHYFIAAMKKSFTMRGRARRAEFAWFTLITFLMSIAFNIISDFADRLGMEALASSLNLISSIIGLVMFPASITIAVRRFHDLGKSGWWYVGYIAVIFIGLAYIIFSLASVIMYNPQLSEDEIWAFILSGKTLIPFLLLVVFAYGVILFLIFKDGQRFTNTYGEDPKAPQQPPVHIEPTLSNTPEAEKPTVTIEKF